ncbi:MAG: glycerate kinase [Bacillota bacterium]|nr:glycerate kinase [Bacillota bacterium]
MKVVVASDKFKGSLLSNEVANHIEIGIKKASCDIEVIKVPMADGGEGTVQSLVEGLKGKIVKKKVVDPLGRPTESFMGILEDRNTAIIEMAASSGLMLLSASERNPMKTTTYGFGELIKGALDMDCRNFILGIGGSATNDGGAGMLQALGAKLLDINGYEIGYGGESLSKVSTIDLSGFDGRISESKITVACDVDNPLCGSNGASYIYGIQKGADKNMVEILDKNLYHFGKLIEKAAGKSVIDCAGSGAAGGLGAALIAFFNAEMKKGIDLVIELTGLENIIKDADLVLTGEGGMDFQTKFGKTPYGVAQIAKKYNLPVIAIAGSLGTGFEELYNNGFDAIFSIVDKPMSLEQAFENSKQLLEAAAERIIRVLMIDLNRKKAGNSY